MQNIPFSKKTIQMLEDNEFAVKKDGAFLSFKKVSLAKAILLVPVFFLSLIAVAHIQQHPLKTLVAILIIALITKVIWTRLTKKLHFQIDFSDNTFKFYDYKRNLHWHYLQDIEELSWSSKFVSEYASAFKSTSEEHEVSFKIKLKNGRVLTIFKFASDYAEPTKEINELYSFFENTFKNIKVI